MLDISLTGMLWTVVNLFVLYVLMKKFLWGPVTAMIESRRKEIEDDLDGAAARNAEAEAKRVKYDRQLVHAEQEAALLVAQAKERGEREYQLILDQAKDDARKLTAQAQARIRQERAEMVRGARREVASLALLAAAKVSRKELDADADRALVDRFLDQAGEGL